MRVRILCVCASSSSSHPHSSAFFLSFAACSICVEVSGPFLISSLFFVRYTVPFTAPTFCTPIGGVGSGGWTFVLVVTVSFTVYMVAGILFKRFKLGIVEWRESIPNIDFWVELPGLVKDGCGFFVAKVYQLMGKGDGAYTPIGGNGTPASGGSGYGGYSDAGAYGQKQPEVGGANASSYY